MGNGDNLSPTPVVLPPRHLMCMVQRTAPAAAPETCAGLYALRFCQQREIETTGLSVVLTTEKEEGESRVARLRIEMRLPERFPEKYRDAIVRAVDQCTVKRHILDPPAFEVTVVGAPVLSPVT